MFTQDDLIDAILAAFRARGAGRTPSGAPASPPAPAARPRVAFQEAGPRGRQFLTEYEIKKALTPGDKHLKIPKDAIVSPLAQDWLALRGIQLIRE